LGAHKIVVEGSGDREEKCWVFKECRENLALGMPTKQSSTFNSNTPASNAVDGDINPNHAGHRCTHTTSQVEPWFRVDLGGSATVTDVALYNRLDCSGCSERLNNFLVSIGDNPNGFSSNPECGISPHSNNGKYRQAVYCRAPVKGRYVYITLLGNKNKVLSICEIEVHGNFDANDLSGLMSHSLSGLIDQPNVAEQWNNAETSCTSSGTCSQEYNNLRADMGKVSAGFGAATNIMNGIVNSLKTGDFSHIATTLGKIAPFLGAFGPIASLIGLFGPSPEMQRLDQVISMLNEGFSNIESRFDQLENKIDYLEDTIIKEHFWTRMTDSLAALNTVDQKVNDYFSVVAPAEREERKNDLNLEQLNNAYQAIITIRDTFKGALGAKPLCELASEFTRVNRMAVLHVSIDLYNRMVRGSANMVLIGKLLERDDQESREKELEALLLDIGDMIGQCDTKIRKETWITQFRKDFQDDVMDQNFGKGKVAEIATRINEAFTTKYYWREWMVVVYPEMEGYGKHYRRVCHAHTYTRNTRNYKGYNIFVSSVATTSSLKLTQNIKVEAPERSAKKIFEKYLDSKTPCSKTSFAGVALSATTTKAYQFKIIAPERRQFYKRVKNVEYICRNNRLPLCQYEPQSYNAFILA